MSVPVLAMKKVGVRSHCERLGVLVVALVRRGEDGTLWAGPGLVVVSHQLLSPPPASRLPPPSVGRSSYFTSLDSQTTTTTTKDGAGQACIVLHICIIFLKLATSKLRFFTSGFIRCCHTEVIRRTENNIIFTDYFYIFKIFYYKL